MVILTLVPSTIAVVIAALVAFIAWRQWQTAREKLVLDLFEKRWAIYEAAEIAVRKVMMDGDVTGNTAIIDIAVIRSKAKFLFGPEVEVALGDLQIAMSELGRGRDMLRSGEQEGALMSSTALKKITKFREGFMELCGPYMNMTAKLPG